MGVALTKLSGQFVTAHPRHQLGDQHIEGTQLLVQIQRVLSIGGAGRYLAGTAKDLVNEVSHRSFIVGDARDIYEKDGSPGCKPLSKAGLKSLHYTCRGGIGSA